MTLGRLSLLALIAAGLSFLIFSPGPRYERHGPAIDFVEQTVAVTADVAHERLGSGLSDALESDQGFPRSRVVEYKGQGFPTKRMMDFHLDNNVSLARYAQLGDEAWTRDIFVRGPYKPWFSEYLDGAKPVPFSTDFLIHLEPIADDRTRIEVIEYAPKVTVGTNFHLCGRHLFPGFSPDTRPVTPTTKDRQEMLDLVVSVVEREPR